jgi:glutamyl/glutaminyl-tRNA synthetase
MEISHVMRAEEWLSSAPKHLQLNEALGYEPPIYAHLPLIHGPDHKKLSKRTGDTAALEYRDNGYLPDAMVNFLALLGWSLDDKTTIIPRETFIREFSLERVVPNPAVFDIARLDYLNGQYIRELDDVRSGATSWLEWCDRGLPRRSTAHRWDVITAAAPLLKERVAKLRRHRWPFSFPLHLRRAPYELSLLAERAGGDTAEAVRILDAALLALDAVPEDQWTKEPCRGGYPRPAGFSRAEAAQVHLSPLCRRDGESPGDPVVRFDGHPRPSTDSLQRLRTARLKLD